MPSFRLCWHTPATSRERGDSRIHRFKMWNMHGIEPEIIDYKTMQIVYNGYHLRPEIVESTYYLASFHA